MTFKSQVKLHFTSTHIIDLFKKKKGRKKMNTSTIYFYAVRSFTTQLRAELMTDLFRNGSTL